MVERERWLKRRKKTEKERKIKECKREAGTNREREREEIERHRRPRETSCHVKTSLLLPTVLTQGCPASRELQILISFH